MNFKPQSLAMPNPCNPQAWSLPHAQRSQPFFSAASLLVASLALLNFPPRPAQAANLYCTYLSASSCRGLPSSGSASSNDTYFWQPTSSTINSSPIGTISLSSLNNQRAITSQPKLNRLTLVWSSNLNPSAQLQGLGTSGNDTLVGSLGTDSLTGGGGNDVYVVGSASHCLVNPIRLVDCKVEPSLSTSGTTIPAPTQDTISLSGTASVIYISYCLQYNLASTTTSSAAPKGYGGKYVTQATKSNNVNSSSNQSVSTDYDPFGCSSSQAWAPQPHSWSAASLWQWLMASSQAVVSSILRGPPAWAQTTLDLPLQDGQPVYPGAVRIVQNSEGFFGSKDGSSGSRIHVDGSKLSFNGEPLACISSQGSSRCQTAISSVKLYNQLSSNDAIPLGQGISFVYHQALGLLVAYSNDTSPYGSPQNQGQVIAQLLQPSGNGTNLLRYSQPPSASLDWVIAEDLSSGLVQSLHSSAKVSSPSSPRS